MSIVNSRVGIDSFFREGAQKLRWTVRGSIQGTIARAASSGTLSITTADGDQTWTGNWTTAVAGTPVLNIDLSPLDDLRTNQTITLTAAVENIPPSVTMLKFDWNLGESKCISADPSGSQERPVLDEVDMLRGSGDSNGCIQFIAPINGKATVSITIKASDIPLSDTIALWVEDPNSQAVNLEIQKNYSIR
ncbi:hypothetical protein ACFLT9_06890 [Acidobacteriota bacterium]